MPTPRVNSIVKLVNLDDPDVKVFDVKATDRFVYRGEIAQDPTRCIVEGVFCNKRLVHLRPEDFEEVASDDF